MRSRLPLAGIIVTLLLLSAAGCGAPQGGNDSGQSRFAGKADSGRMMQTISYMAGEELQGRPTGSPQSAELESYLMKQFSDLGLQPPEALGLTDYREEFPVPTERLFLENTPSGETVTAANILGEIRGEPGSEILILAANYDGLGIDVKTGSIYPGADYNASGSSAVLELARLFSEIKQRPKKTVMFALLGGEECGNYGSQALAAAIESAGLRQAVSIINIEGIGAGQGNYMDVWNLDYRKNEPAADALAGAADLLGVELEPGGADSGTSSNVFFLFHQAAVTCDWSWYERSEHPDFHKTSDVAEKINEQGLKNVTEVVAQATWDLAYE
jgi:Peptidase family M28